MPKLHLGILNELQKVQVNLGSRHCKCLKGVSEDVSLVCSFLNAIGDGSGNYSYHLAVDSFFWSFRSYKIIWQIFLKIYPNRMTTQNFALD